MISARAEHLEPGDRIYVRDHDQPVRVVTVDHERATWVTFTCPCCARAYRKRTVRFTPWTNVRLAP